jgi:serine/threonine protein kinase
VAAYNIAQHLVLERQILLHVDHTMILKLIKTFKDDRRVYFLTEYVNGIDLFDALREIGL